MFCFQRFFIESGQNAEKKPYDTSFRMDISSFFFISAIITKHIRRR